MKENMTLIQAERKQSSLVVADILSLTTGQK